MKIVFLLFLALFSTTAFSGENDRFCFSLGDVSEKVCSLPLSVLIARGNEFDGRIVIVTGYFAYAEIPMLFSGEESFLSSTAEDGIAVTMPTDKRLASRIFGLNHSTVVMMGRFSAKPVSTIGYGGYHTGGRLTDIRSVGSRLAPWGYSEPKPFGTGDGSKGLPPADK